MKIGISNLIWMVNEAINRVIVKEATSQLTVLWLDDVREPRNYLSKKKDTGAYLRNIEFYNSLMSKYNVDFVWVKNINEFSDYIKNNGLPKFVSFDFDLGKGLPKGSECARWLYSYCIENGYNVPKYFVHSANPRAKKLIDDAMSGNNM